MKNKNIKKSVKTIDKTLKIMYYILVRRKTYK